MNNQKFNMIFAALLCAGIIAMLAGFIASHAMPVQHLEKDAVAVEAAAAGGGGGAAAIAMPEPILGLIAAADVERGKSVAKSCAACHSFDQGGPNGVGPGLYGIVGHKKQAHAGFAYSGAMTEKGGDVWTYAELNKFLWKPKAYSPGTKMNFIGVKKPEDRAAVIAYLRTLGGPDNPSQAEINAELAELAPPVVEEAAAPASEAPANAPAAN
jgi:cytochrome c